MSTRCGTSSSSDRREESLRKPACRLHLGRALGARMNTPMKLPGARGSLQVAVVTETYPPEVNGVARTVGLMVEALLQRGHEVRLIRPRQGGERAPSSAQVPRERLVARFAIPLYLHPHIGLASPSMLHKEWSQL